MASWWSILPESIIFVETWAIKIFIMLGILVLFPWFLLLIYDIILFVFRVATYDIPIIGGRARNRPRPRAPSLSERPSGRSRGLSLNLTGARDPTNPTAKQEAAEAVEGLKQRLVTNSEIGNGHKISENSPFTDE